MDILIVDDEPYIQRSLSYVLKREGFDIELASNGEEGLRKAKELKPKIIFLDIVMPKLNGFDTCHAIRSEPELNDSHVILLTAKGQDVDMERGKKEGANEYMTKPFSPKEVVAKVRNILEHLP